MKKGGLAVGTCRFKQIRVTEEYISVARNRTLSDFEAVIQRDHVAWVGRRRALHRRSFVMGILTLLVTIWSIYFLPTDFRDAILVLAIPAAIVAFLFAYLLGERGLVIRVDSGDTFILRWASSKGALETLLQAMGHPAASSLHAGSDIAPDNSQSPVAGSPPLGESLRGKNQSSFLKDRIEDLRARKREKQDLKGHLDEEKHHRWP